MMRTLTIIVLTLLLIIPNVFGQPTNDECADAINITSILAYCSDIEEFTTENATTNAGYGTPALCSPTWDGNQNDVWFTFSTTATVIDLSISVIGATMQQPQIAIYRGDCSGFAELICMQATAGTNTVTLDVLSLDPSEMYYMRINAATTGSDGTFQLCIDEFASNIISNTTTTECSGVLYDTGGPNGSYGAFEAFEFSICPSEPHGCISIDLVSLETEPIFDQLTIYDGEDATAPLFMGFSGTAENLFNNIPTTGCVTLTFGTDGGNQFAGFELTWTCSLTCPTPPPDIQTCDGTFYDSGGPNNDYSSSEEITTIICPDPDSTGQCVYANFTEFNIETGFDDMFIYDGPTEDATIIGTYTGTDSPGIVFSTDSCITVVFNSDISLTAPGWMAEITCLPCGTPAPCIGETPTCDLSDTCDIACDLGTLDSPSACPNSVPVTQAFCLDNTGATAPTPYIAQTDCIDGNDLPNPAADIWYSFEASSNQIEISMTSFLNAASVALYEGTTCDALTPLACNNSTNGAVSLFVTGIQPGDTYYLQISGEDENDTGEINLDIEISTDCSVPIVYMLDCGDDTFYDSGGENNNYSSGENTLTVICPQPDSTGQCVLLNFTQFETENNFDDLFIYDGVNETAPLIGTYTGADSPGVVVASDSCLTVVFQSDGSVTAPGWIAEILCIECGTTPPCLGVTPTCDLPDNCGIACSLDTLNSPSSCPSTVLARQSFCFNNTGATASMPYISQVACMDSTDMPNPAADIWYSFVASSNQLNFDIESELIGASIALYEGEICDMLTPLACNNRMTGAVDLFVTSIQPGQLYYLQISGADENDVGQINLEIESSLDCDAPIVYNLTCADSVFYDTGGPQGDYDNGELIQTTICPDLDSMNQCVFLNFTEFNIENGFDDLFIYDGADTNAPLIGEFTGVDSPGSIIATGGCLTILFDSDASATSSGWSADILCVECGTIPPCLGDTPTCDLPDNCSEACDLGTLNVPTVCPLSVAAVQQFCIDNIGATAETMFNGQVGCDDGTDIPSPAADVWYSFVASSNQLTISIQSELNAASVGLYQGSNCNNLLPFGCNNSTNGNVSLFAVGVQPDSTYFVQISGADEADQGAINLEIESSNNCNFCIITAGINAMPTPTNNTYAPGDTVNFCFTITEWNQTASNWIHAVVPRFGPGWDTSSLTPTVIPPSCDLEGEWLWQESITGTAEVPTNVGTVGPGFVYDSGLGGPLDGNGENNYGDNCSGEQGSWEFCWQISVGGDCTGEPGALTMEIETYGDSETGSWTTGACEDDVTFSIGQISCNSCLSPTITGTVTSPDCAGNGASIEVAVTGGIEPYAYAWSDPNIGDTPNASNLASGTYTLTVNDATDCSATEQFVLSDNTLTSTIQTVSGNCGASGGEIIINTTGGTPPYEYSIDAGMTFQTANSFTNLQEGTYDIIIKDADECEGAIMTNILSGNSPTIDSINVVDTSCGMENGVIFIIASGGAPPYQYSINGVDFQANSTFTGLAGGTYNVVVQDATGCTATQEVTVLAGANPTIIAVQTTDPSSCGSFDGAIQMLVDGGTEPLSYSNDNGMNYQPSPNFTGLGDNTYNLVVKDAVGCFDTLIVTLIEPKPPIIDSIYINNPECGENNGTIEILASGGNPDFEYSIDNGANFQNNNIFNNLSNNTYSIIVQDSLGCQAISEITLTQLGAPTFTDIQITNPTCGDDNGIINIIAEGGVTPYGYSIGGAFQMAATFTDLSPDTYTVVVRDAEGCVAEMLINLTDNGAVMANITSTNPTSCTINDGTISIDVNSGTLPYEYSIDNGMTYQTTNSFTDLSANIYNVVVQDSIGCIFVQVVELQGLDAPEITNIQITDASCGTPDGTIEVTAIGGAPNYQYSIDDGATFQDSNSFIDLSGGLYEVIVQDSLGCQVSEQAIINSLDAPEISNIQITEPTCGNQDGQITIFATSGTSPYTYSIDGGTFGMSNNFSNLAGGTYDVVVQDAANCEVVQQIIIPDLGAVLIDNIETTNAFCNNENGEITVFASGGQSPYTYSIDNGQNVQASNTFTGLAVGTYNVVVTDANDCQTTQNFDISSDGLPVIDNINATNTSCGGADGALEITVSGGTPPYQYSIDNGNTFQGNNLFDNLPSGTYQVVVQDFNGCEVMQTIEVIQTGAIPTITADGSITLCEGETVNLSVGTYPSYEWSTGATVSTITVNEAGIYSVTIVDADGCIGTAQQSVSVIAPIIVDAGDDQEVPVGTDYEVTAAATGVGVVYTWSGSDGSSYTGESFTASATQEGTITYTVTATLNGCPVTDEITIRITDDVSWEIANVFSPNGDMLNDDFGIITTATVTTFKVFNRWGELVHDSTNRWDGTFRGAEQVSDIYTYYIVLQNFDGEAVPVTGDVFLMR